MKQNFFLLIAILIIASSCSNYQKVLSGSDYDKKVELADRLYSEKQYLRALPLYDELKNIYRGPAEAQIALLRTAYCEYYTSELYLAAHYFKQYYDSYPYNKNAEEALYMHSLCLYELSPKHTLDQNSTKKALNSFQLFINKFPTSDKVDKCNMFIDQLRAKQELKDFENASLFHKIEDYKASVWALNNFLDTYPSSNFAEEAYFLMAESAYLLAKNSVLKKQVERYINTIDICKDFKRRFANSDANKKIEEYQTKSQNALKTLK